MNIKHLVKIAFERASSQNDKGDIVRIINNNRSKAFVGALAEIFKEEYRLSPSIHVLWRGEFGNRGKFGLNELMYDILVCDTVNMPSYFHKRQLTCITKALWMVESEFHTSSREIIYDFNKLLIGKSENKLLLTKSRKDTKDFCEFLNQAVPDYTDQIFIAFIPHPKDWGRGQDNIEVWQLHENNPLKLINLAF